MWQGFEYDKEVEALSLNPNITKIVSQLFCYVCITCEYIIEHNILAKTK